MKNISFTTSVSDDRKIQNWITDNQEDLDSNSNPMDYSELANLILGMILNKYTEPENYFEDYELEAWALDEGFERKDE